MQALIVTGGSIVDEFTLDFIKQHSCGLVIAVDHGMEFFYRCGLVPDYIVGDFDSVSPEILSYFQRDDFRVKVLHFQPEKDETDTELAIRTALHHKAERIYLLGAAGSRIDHMLGNIHLLGMAMEQEVECLMIDPYNCIRMLKTGLVLKKQEQYGDYVSLIPFTPRVTGLTLKGFKYPLHNYGLECYHSLGVSNEILEEEAEISFEDGILLMVESKDKK